MAKDKPKKVKKIYEKNNKGKIVPKVKEEKFVWKSNRAFRKGDIFKNDSDQLEEVIETVVDQFGGITHYSKLIEGEVVE